MRFFYKWNALLKAAFICWLLGGIFIVGGVFFVWFAFQQQFAMNLPGPLIALVVGVILLATGGTLHQIGSNREIDRTSKDD